MERLEDGHTDEKRWLAEMEQRQGFTWEVNNLLRSDRWSKPSRAVKQALDYARVMGPEFDGRGFFRDRSTRRSTEWIRRLLRPKVMRIRPVLRFVTGTLSAVDQAMPVGRDLRRYLDRRRPDLLVLSPHLPPGSLHATYIKEAQARSIPVALCIASWDNLTSKQLIRAVPDRTLVWNETQRREAVDIHGLPTDSIAVTGAQVFDSWLEFQPSTREAFCARAGLDPRRPFILYTACALIPSRRTEWEWVVDWLDRLRAADDPLLRTAGVLVRPHPKRNPDWDNASVDDYENVVIFPHGHLHMPIEHDRRRDYYDSIHHSAAVVGLNSTAMIEAAIAGRPVYTMLVDEFHESQGGMFHFEYLLDEFGGPVKPARTFEEHHAHLAAALAGTDEQATERARRFVGAFVRPHGVDSPATPVVVETIEEVARAGRAEPLRAPFWVPPLRLVIVLAVYLAQPRQAWRGVRVRWGRLRRLAPAK